MKVGYSFESLVNRVAAVDESAVHKTGDETVAGLKTFTSCPASSGAQGTAGTHLTRRDFVLAELNKKLNLSGGTLTGNLTAPAVLVSSAQNTSVNALTRKDYVDSAIAAGDALQVSKTGDTMTGNLTVPAVSLSGSQSSAPNTLTRKDYVDTQDALKVNSSDVSSAGTWDGIVSKIPKHSSAGVLEVGRYLDLHTTNSTLDYDVRLEARPDGIFGISLDPSVGAGGIMTFKPGGELSVSNSVIVNAAQSSKANSLTRKDYVDSTIAAGDALQVSKAGDTMTGHLTISNASPIFTLNETDTGKKWLLVADGNSCRFQMDSTAGRNAWEVNSNGTVSIYDPISTTAQGGTAGSLTRKDYVDGEIAKQVSKTGDTMSGNLTAPKVLVSGAQGAEGNALTRKDYVDTQLSGKLSTSGGTITGPLRVQADVAKLVLADGTGSVLAILHDRGYTAFREGEQGVDLLALQGGETPTVTMRNPRAALAQEQQPQSLTRKDYVDAQVATRAPTTHTHTAALANSNVVQGQHSVVGSYIFATLKPTAGSTANPGTNVSGVNLHPCGAAAYSENRAWVLAGTWMCMGAFNATNSDDSWDDRATLWFRVA